MPEDERAAACALAGLSGIGGQSLTIIRLAHGSLAAAVSRGGAALAETPGLRADGVQSLRAAPDLAARGQWLVSKAQELGVQILVPDDADYPELLKSTAGAPPVLYLLGTLKPQRRVAVVGTRQVDRYGTVRTQAAVDRLVAAGVEVVSGGAVGVDAVAHQHAIDRGGRTVAVIGNGLIAPYPAKNRLLFDRIVKQGALLTEFALDAGGNQTHYPQRNRTMAGLSEAVIITRGAEGSGALTTCQSAMRFHRPVFAVPGEVGDPLAFAPNSQLSLGARALVSGDEVLGAIGLQPSSEPVAPLAAPAREEDLSKLPAPLRSVYVTLGPAPRHVDEIASEAGVPTSEALSALLQLELGNLCVAKPGKYFVRR